MSERPQLGPVVKVILARPSLWLPALAAARRFAPRHWWRRAPYLPVPDPNYWHFRMVTLNGGDGSGPIDPEAVAAYLRWSRAMGSSSR